MIKSLFIYGAGGCGRETKMLVDQINEHKLTWNIIGFIDDDPKKIGKVVTDNLKIIGNSNFILNLNEEAGVVIAIGDVFAKKKVYDKIKINDKISFPNIIHPTANVEKKTLKTGKGNIFSIGSIISTNASIGDFNNIHLNVSIGHDVRLGNFNNIFPGANIAGNVKIDNFCEFGLGCSIRQNINIPNNVRIGANSFVIKNLEPNYSYIGIPVKKFFRLEDYKKKI